MKASVVAALLAVSVVYAQDALRIETPAPVQCQPSLLTWSGGVPPYFVDLLDGDDLTAPALAELENSTNDVKVTWKVNFKADTRLNLRVRDNTGATANTAIFTVGSSSTTSCLDGGASSSSASGSASASSGGKPTSSGSTKPTSNSAAASQSSAVSSIAASASSVASSALSSLSSVANSITSKASSSGSGSSGSTKPSSTAPSGSDSAAPSTTGNGASSLTVGAAGVFGAVAALFVL